MESEKPPIKLTRKELESIVFKSGKRSYNVSVGVIFLYAAALVCTLLIILMALPQTMVDGWVRRLQSGSQAISQSSLVNPEKLELIKLDDDWVNPMFSIAGVIRNRVPNETLQGVEAVIKLYGKKGPITMLVVDLDEPSLQPNQRGGFRASYKYASDSDTLTHYELSFKLKDGTPVPHQDLRGAAPG